MEATTVSIASYPTASEAEAARLALEAAGIRALLSNAEVNRLLGSAAGFVELQVAAPDADDARRILHQGDSVELPDEGPSAAVASNTCLSCGSAMPENVDTCPACGWTYGQLPPTE